MSPSGRLRPASCRADRACAGHRRRRSRLSRVRLVPAAHVRRLGARVGSDDGGRGVRARLWATACRGAVRARRIRARRDYVVTPVVGVVSPRARRRRDPGRHLQHRLPGPRRAPVADGRRRRGVQRPHRRRERRVRRRQRDRLSVRVGDHDARDRRARRDRARDARRRCVPRTCISSCRTSAPAPWSRRSSRWPPRRDRCRSRPC